MKKIIGGLALAMFLSIQPSCLAQPVQAAENDLAHKIKPVAMKRVYHPVHKEGKISQWSDKGFLLTPDDGSQQVYLHTARTKYFLNGKNGKEVLKKTFKNGKKVTVYHSPIMTRSIPPQSNLVAILSGTGNKIGKLEQVGSVAWSGEELKIVNVQRDLIITVPKAPVYVEEVSEHDWVLAWYDIVALSMPGQTTAHKIVLLPRKNIQ